MTMKTVPMTERMRKSRAGEQSFISF
jgi:hypothetical protein